MVVLYETSHWKHVSVVEVAGINMPRRSLLIFIQMIVGLPRVVELVPAARRWS
jgi:hypothetical protein